MQCLFINLDFEHLNHSNPTKTLEDTRTLKIKLKLKKKKILKIESRFQDLQNLRILGDQFCKKTDSC